MRKAAAVFLAAFLLTASFSAAEGMISIQLVQDGTQSGTEGVSVDGNTVTISRPGEYLISGTLAQGELRIENRESGKVTLYLNGVSVHNENGPAIRIVECSPRAVISLVEGSANFLSDGTSLILETEDEPDGVIFSRSDLTIEGAGSLEIKAGAMNGIVSKDDIRIEGGKLSIDAPNHGIKGKDSVEISGGEISIRAGKDGIKSTNKKDGDRGFLEITGGRISIFCGDDPLGFITSCHITGGEISIKKEE